MRPHIRHIPRIVCDDFRSTTQCHLNTHCLHCEMQIKVLKPLFPYGNCSGQRAQCHKQITFPRQIHTQEDHWHDDHVADSFDFFAPCRGVKEGLQLNVRLGSNKRVLRQLHASLSLFPLQETSAPQTCEMQCIQFVYAR